MTRDEMSDEGREWCQKHGVQFDEGGYPMPAAVPGPPRPCARCGALAERPSEFAAAHGGRVFSGVQCVECFRLSRTDLRAWAAGFHEG